MAPVPFRRQRCVRSSRADSIPRLDTTEDAVLALQTIATDDPATDACVLLVAASRQRRLAVVIDGAPGDPPDFSALTSLCMELSAQSDVERITIGRIAPVPVLSLVTSEAQRLGWAALIDAIDGTATQLVDVVALGSDAAWSLRQAARFDGFSVDDDG